MAGAALCHRPCQGLEHQTMFVDPDAVAQEPVLAEVDVPWHSCAAVLAALPELAETAALHKVALQAGLAGAAVPAEAAVPAQAAEPAVPAEGCSVCWSRCTWPRRCFVFEC